MIVSLHLNEYFQFHWSIIHADMSSKILLASVSALLVLVFNLSALVALSLKLHLIFWLFIDEETFCNQYHRHTTTVSYGFLFLCEFFLTCHVGFKAIGYGVDNRLIICNLLSFGISNDLKCKLEPPTQVMCSTPLCHDINKAMANSIFPSIDHYELRGKCWCLRELTLFNGWSCFGKWMPCF